MFTELLDRMRGKVHFYITVGEKPAAEISIEGKHVIIEVKSLHLSLEALLPELLKRRQGGDLLGKFKKKGYKFTIKYRMLEFPL